MTTYQTSDNRSRLSLLSYLRWHQFDLPRHNRFTQPAINRWSTDYISDDGNAKLLNNHIVLKFYLFWTQLVDSENVFVPLKDARIETNSPPSSSDTIQTSDIFLFKVQRFFYDHDTKHHQVMCVKVLARTRIKSKFWILNEDCVEIKTSLSYNTEWLAWGASSPPSSLWLVKCCPGSQGKLLVGRERTLAGVVVSIEMVNVLIISTRLWLLTLKLIITAALHRALYLASFSLLLCPLIT